MSDTKYPEIEVELIGQNGNATSLIGLVRCGLRKGGVPQEEIKEFASDAMSGDYNHVLTVIQSWVTVI